MNIELGQNKKYVHRGSTPIGEDVTCRKCGKKFHVKPSRLAEGKGKFCSRVCQLTAGPHFDLAWLTQLFCIERLSIEKIAEMAGVSRVGIANQITAFGLIRKRLAPSPEHIKKIARKPGYKMSEDSKNKIRLAQLGPLGHNWKGGDRKGRFLSPWRLNKKLALERDGYKCTQCGADKLKNGGRNVDVHHKIPFRAFRDYRDAHALDNLTCLCVKCHLIREAQTRITDSSFGKGCKSWHYVNIYGAFFGENVAIGSFCEIGPTVRIGNNTSIGAKCFIPEGVTIGEGCFIAPCVVMTNDKMPPSPKHLWGKTVVMDGARIGAASTILPGLVIGKGALIGAGSVVTKSVPDYQVWAGNPAKFIRELK